MRRSFRSFRLSRRTAACELRLHALEPRLQGWKNPDPSRSAILPAGGWPLKRRSSTRLGATGATTRRRKGGLAPPSLQPDELLERGALLVRGGGLESDQRPVLGVDGGVDDAAVADRLGVGPRGCEEVLVELLEALGVAVPAVRARELRLAAQRRAVGAQVAGDEREGAEEGGGLRHLAVRPDAQLARDRGLGEVLADDDHRLRIARLEEPDEAREVVGRDARRRLLR